MLSCQCLDCLYARARAEKVWAWAAVWELSLG